jgi:DNA gyrase/topoisomerase IV subunit B
MCTSLHSGGKFEEGEGYKSSLGLHGLGASLVQSLSSTFSILSTREDGSASLLIENGEVKNFIIEDKHNSSTGTIVEFIPDEKIFGKLKWDKKIITEELQLHALLNNGLEFILYFDDDKPISYKYSNGIQDMLRLKVGDSETISDPYYFSTVINENMPNEFKIEFAFQYTKRPGEYIFPFTNGGYNPDLGTHVTGWKSAFTSFINTNAKKLGLLDKEDTNLSGELIRRGLVLVLSIKMDERPMFAEQTKLKLTSPSARAATSQAVGKMNMPRKTLKQIIKKALIEQKAENAAERAREAAKKVKSGGKNLNTLKDMPSKLVDCIDRVNGELFICEGNSASGAAVMGRDAKTQAVLGLRGKVLNTHDKELDQIVENKEIKDMLTAFGTGVGNQFNIKNLRYKRIILMSDADPDGAHINILLLTLFVKHLPELIKQNKVFVSVPPLYKMKVAGNKTPIFFATEEDLKKTNLKGEITRMKGLGEFNADELWQTTMNPKTRRLLQVTTDNFDATLELFQTLMGNSAAARREFIENHDLNNGEDGEYFYDDGEE